MKNKKNGPNAKVENKGASKLKKRKSALVAASVARSATSVVKKTSDHSLENNGTNTSYDDEVIHDTGE